VNERRFFVAVGESLVMLVNEFVRSTQVVVQKSSCELIYMKATDGYGSHSDFSTSHRLNHSFWILGSVGCAGKKEERNLFVQSQ
jgi:hypothetical protein